MSDAGEPCPICHSSTNGCAVRDEGAFCRARRLPPAPASSRPARVGLADFLSAVGYDSDSAEVRRKLVAHACVMWGASMRRMLGLESRGVLMFRLPESPHVPCKRCGSLVAWAKLPTGGKIAISVATLEPHDASCPAL